MPPLGNRALETRIVRIPREEREQLRLSGKTRIGAVVVDDGLEAGDAADGFGRSWP